MIKNKYDLRLMISCINIISDRLHINQRDAYAIYKDKILNIIHEDKYDYIQDIVKEVLNNEQ